MNDPDDDDIQLMASLARGQMEALGELVRRHQANVLGLAHRLLGQQDHAEDVAQEAFLRVRRAARQFRPEAKFSTWLYRIVVNLCQDRLRRLCRAPVELSADRIDARHDEPLDELAARELAERVRRAVASLPERQRTAVLLHRFQQLSHVEIAEVTGWSASTVESLLVRAYRQLRRSLADLDNGPQTHRRPGDDRALKE